MEQTRYGLIGSKLGHSYSKIIHEQIADYTYELMPLPTEDEARAFMERRDFAAINVTIPYKQLVIPYCDVVDPKAAAIGAVNTIVNRDGRLYGYNTDYAGFSYLARAHGVDFAGKTVLILGTGGTHSTVTAVCKDGGAAEILTASRTGKGDALTYEEAMRRKDVQVIVNTTPCGMYPNVGQCLIDPAAFPALEAVLDVVYNPFRTELLLRAEEHHIPAASGFEMLVAQAVFAAEHFTGKALDADTLIPAVSRQLRHELANISIIGMPGCGKSTIGAALAKKLGKTFIDLGGAAGCFLRVVLRRLAAAKPGRAVGRAPGGFLPQGLLFGFRLGRFCLCLPHLHLLAQGGAFFGRETGAAGGDDAVFTLRRGGHRLRGRGGMLGRAGCR